MVSARTPSKSTAMRKTKLDLHLPQSLAGSACFSFSHSANGVDYEVDCGQGGGNLQR